MSAPRSRRIMTTRRWPTFAAQWRAVHPSYWNTTEQYGTTHNTYTWNNNSMHITHTYIPTYMNILIIYYTGYKLYNMYKCMYVCMYVCIVLCIFVGGRRCRLGSFLRLTHTKNVKMAIWVLSCVLFSRSRRQLICTAQYVCVYVRSFSLHCSGPGYRLLSRPVVPPPQSDHRK